VHQVGFHCTMYLDARSTKHKNDYRKCHKERKALKEKLLATFYGRMDVISVEFQVTKEKLRRIVARCLNIKT